MDAVAASAVIGASNAETAVQNTAIAKNREIFFFIQIPPFALISIV